MQDALVKGFLQGLLVAIFAIIIRFLYRRYKLTTNNDIFIKHLNFEKCTDLIKIKLCLEYWVKMKNNPKIVKVAKRLLDFNYTDIYGNEEIVKAIFLLENILLMMKCTSIQS